MHQCFPVVSSILFCFLQFGLYIFLDHVSYFIRFMTVLSSLLTIFVACLPLLCHLWLQLCHPSVTEGHPPWLTVVSQVFPDAWSILGIQQILVKKIAKEKKQGREGYKNTCPTPHLIYFLLISTLCGKAS